MKKKVYVCNRRNIVRPTDLSSLNFHCSCFSGIPCKGNCQYYRSSLVYFQKNMKCSCVFLVVLEMAENVLNLLVMHLNAFESQLVKENYVNKQV